MPGYKAFDEPTWARSAISEALDADEQLEALAPFVGLSQARNKRILVLTNRNLRVVSFKAATIPSARPRPVVYNFAIPLHTISGIAVRRVPPGLATQARVMIRVHWTGESKAWASVTTEGDHLVRSLEDALARRTASVQGAGVADEIAKLSELAAEGAISSEEFERGKELFLVRPPDQAAETVALLRQLHALNMGEVLSESELNMKKWDLLSKRTI